ncbi:MAG: archaeal proteasome endopeptidase complex subunit beta [Thermoprotei archaeon]|nr:archaeal proteasome endopeptidase complex subunit beta [Thermoprotei archaeon]
MYTNPYMGFQPDKIMVLKGTTTVGVICSDGVILGTDRRATSGYYIAHKHVKKIFKIDDYVAATMAGVVAEAQKVLDRVRLEVQLYRYTMGRPMPIKSIATFASNLLFSSRLYPYVIQTIIAGVDSQGPDMYAIDWFGTLTREKYIATGSGSPIALGVLEDSLHEGMRVKEALPVVIRAISSAIKRDPGSGEGVDIVVVTKEGYKELTDEEIKRLLLK